MTEQEAEQKRRDERKKLGRLREMAALMKNDLWLVDHDDRGTQVVTRRAGGQEASVCLFSRRASSDETRLISNALPNLLFLIDLYDRAIARVRVLSVELQEAEQVRGAPPQRQGDFAAQAAMMLPTVLFQQFLEEKTGKVIVDAAGADIALKMLLTIKSKREINEDGEARGRFFDLRAEFDAWKRGAPA